MLVYALLGTSRVLSVSSTATLAIPTGAQLQLVVPDGDPGKMITAAATLAALTGVLLVFGTLKGIVVAIILSMIGLASQAAKSRVYVIGRKRGQDVLRPLSPKHPDDETFPGLLILRPEGRLFFVNAQQVADAIHVLIVQHQPRVLALDMSRVFDIEYSALQMLIEGEHRVTGGGITVWLAGLSPNVWESFQASGFAEYLGKERLFPNARAVIKRYQEQFASAE